MNAIKITQDGTFIETNLPEDKVWGVFGPLLPLKLHLFEQDGNTYWTNDDLHLELAKVLSETKIVIQVGSDKPDTESALALAVQIDFDVMGGEYKNPKGFISSLIESIRSAGGVDFVGTEEEWVNH
jgi:hypothetical protein